MYDVIIIGGGMSGIAVAREFRDRKILLIEKRNLLSGATGNNAGFIISGFGEHFARTVSRLGLSKAREIQEIHLNTHRKIAELARNIDCDYVAEGSYRIAGDQTELEQLTESYQLMRNCGYDVEWSGDLNCGMKNATPGLWNKHDASLDSKKFWSALAEGIPVVRETEAISVERSGGLNRINTTRGKYDSKIVVFCLNAWSSDLADELRGLYIPLRGQMLSVLLRAPAPHYRPIYTNHGDLYWRFTDRELILGGLEDFHPEFEKGIAEHVISAITSTQLEWINEHIETELIGASPEVLRSWCSTMAFTIDGFPFVGRLHDEDQYVLAGLCGLGHGYVMELASWLKSLIVEEKDVIPDYCSTRRIPSLVPYNGGDWRKLYEAWNH